MRIKDFLVFIVIAILVCLLVDQQFRIQILSSKLESQKNYYDNIITNSKEEVEKEKISKNDKTINNDFLLF